MLGKSFAPPTPSSRMVSVESEEDVRRERALQRFSAKSDGSGAASPKQPGGAVSPPRDGEQGTYSALSAGGVSTDDLDGGNGSAEQKEPAENEEEIEEMLDFQDSVYDLTVQYLCLAVNGSLAFTAGYVNFVCVIGLQCLNLMLQFQMLTEVRRLIMTPAMSRAANLYVDFVEFVYGEEITAVFNTTNFDFEEAKYRLNDWHEKVVLCQFPLVSPLFFLIIMLIWTMFLGHELKQTVFFACQVARLPRHAENHILVRHMDDVVVVTRMSGSLKTCIIVTVFMPKFAIAVTLWLQGAQWLTATSGFENLVLNALALTFICDLDELIFRACVSEATKVGLAKIKLPLPAFSDQPNFSGPIESVLTVGCCIGLTILYIFYYQAIFPSYRWDLPFFCDVE
eukprot:TRINITY_DN3843_c0_g1_i1.p1 TRINITY_DN3843_c0_g1~~TRINITY_DN3843_c0_g1_i1.p1  ORF type:complete len:396 (+),score=77.21 TRINITY_DN3843_c0_g1_i1:135-1322(+)